MTRVLHRDRVLELRPDRLDLLDDEIDAFVEIAHGRLEFNEHLGVDLAEGLVGLLDVQGRHRPAVEGTHNGWADGMDLDSLAAGVFRDPTEKREGRGTGAFEELDEILPAVEQDPCDLVLGVLPRGDLRDIQQRIGAQRLGRGAVLHGLVQRFQRCSLRIKFDINI